jgi:hypothetical protein
VSRLPLQSTSLQSIMNLIQPTKKN